MKHFSRKEYLSKKKQFYFCKLLLHIRKLQIIPLGIFNANLWIADFNLFFETYLDLSIEFQINKNLKRKRCANKIYLHARWIFLFNPVECDSNITAIAFAVFNNAIVYTVYIILRILVFWQDLSRFFYVI